MKCSNCNNDSLYIYQIAAESKMFFCNKHLPSFLEKAKKAGLLQTTAEYKKIIQETVPSIFQKKEEVVEEEEADTAEEPKPKKKATKKKAE